MRSINALILLVISSLLVFAAACGPNDLQYEKYSGFSYETTITLTAENHPHGKGKSNCFNCHVQGNFHVIPNPLAESTKKYSLEDCTGCHCPPSGICP